MFETRRRHLLYVALTSSVLLDGRGKKFAKTVKDSAQIRKANEKQTHNKCIIKCNDAPLST